VRREQPLSREEDKVSALDTLGLYSHAILVPKFISMTDRSLLVILPDVVRYMQACLMQHKPHKPRAVKAIFRRLAKLRMAADISYGQAAQ
jgi:hypothetical protein